MPVFQMYSRLDKNLLKQMLIRMAEIEDDQLASLKYKYFNQAIKKDMDSDDSSYQLTTGNATTGVNVTER